MTMGKVLVIMGSDSDWPKVKPAVSILQSLGIEAAARVISAHRTPEAVDDCIAVARAEGVGAIICAAGMAAHLAGAFAAKCVLPVIGIPIVSGALGGLDALLSTVQMPPGIPVATVGIDNAKNAAYLAAQILAVGDSALRMRLETERENMAQTVYEKDRAIAEEQV